MALTVVLSSCDQWSQGLPFEPDPLFVAQQSIGPEDVLVSHPPGLSIEFPRNPVGRSIRRWERCEQPTGPLEARSLDRTARRHLCPSRPRV